MNSIRAISASLAGVAVLALCTFLYHSIGKNDGEILCGLNSDDVKFITLSKTGDDSVFVDSRERIDYIIDSIVSAGSRRRTIDSVLYALIGDRLISGDYIDIQFGSDSHSRIVPVLTEDGICYINKRGVYRVDGDLWASMNRWLEEETVERDDQMTTSD